MKKLILLLLFIPFIAHSQTTTQGITQNKLWKGYGIADASGTAINQKLQQFIYVEGNQLHLLDIPEKMDMTTGEIFVKPKIDVYTLSGSGSNFTIKNAEKEYQIELVSPTEFQINHKGYLFPFKLIDEAKKSPINAATLSKTIVGSTFENTDKEDRILNTYIDRETAQYQNKDSMSSWESDYKIIEFNGFVFLKGITSPTLLVSQIDGEMIYFIEMDYRFDPKNISWKKR